jgi:hypothetical protein
LRRLVDDEVLTPTQGESVRLALSQGAASRDRPVAWVAEAAGYVGGGLMLGGVGLFLTTSWAELSHVTRGGLLAVFAVAFALGGVLVAGGPGRVRRSLEPGTARRRIVACFLSHRWQRSIVLLVAGVVGVTIAVPQAVMDWTGGAVRGSVALLLAGAVLVVASAVGLRLRRVNARPIASAA